MISRHLLWVFEDQWVVVQPPPSAFPSEGSWSGFFLSSLPRSLPLPSFSPSTHSSKQVPRIFLN